MAQRFLARWGFITAGVLFLFAAIMPAAGGDESKPVFLALGLAFLVLGAAIARRVKNGPASVLAFTLLGLSGAFAAAAPVMFGAAGAAATPDVRASAIPETVDCTFAHPQYAGKCVEKVTPEAKQTPVQACRVILGCLNNSQCVKTYCQSTTIRGGWSLVSPKEKER